MLPEAFLKRIKNQLGGEFPAFMASLERPRAVALRLNPLKGERPSLPFVKAQSKKKKRKVLRKFLKKL